MAVRVLAGRFGVLYAWQALHNPSRRCIAFPVAAWHGRLGGAVPLSAVLAWLGAVGQGEHGNAGIGWARLVLTHRGVTERCSARLVPAGHCAVRHSTAGAAWLSLAVLGSVRHFRRGRRGAVAQGTPGQPLARLEWHGRLGLDVRVMAGRGGVLQGRRGKAGRVVQCLARLGTARRGFAGIPGHFREGMAGPAMRGTAGHGPARHGLAWRGRHCETRRADAIR